MLSCMAINSFGQNSNFYISGTVADSVSKKPVQYASVALYKLGGLAPLKGEITNEKGEFVINNVPGGDYTIKVIFMGYNTRGINLTVIDAPKQIPDPILLKSSTFFLSEVRVTDNAGEKRTTIEKTSISVARNMAVSTGNITEVLKSQPSITVDADNNLYLRGNGNILILMDGKPTTITSLNSIPASNLQNIEIITSPDAKYDSEGTGGIINIITRKSVTGFNGAASLNYGVYNRINGGINLNYGKDIWNMSLNYNAKAERYDVNSILTRQLYAQSTLIDQKILSTQNNTNQMASLLISAKPGKKNSFELGINFLSPDISYNQSISGTQTDGSNSETSYNRLNEIDWKRKVIEGSMSYNRIFEKDKNELSFNVFYSQTKGSRLSDYYLNGKYLQRSEAGGKPQNITFQADYYKQLFRRGRIETGIKLFSRRNSFSSRFYDKDTLSGKWITRQSLSSDLMHSENIYSGYIMYSDSLLKKMYYKIGARVEYNRSDLSETQSNQETKFSRIYPFPFLLLKYKINRAQNFGLSITRRVTRPTYPQLMSYIVVIDQNTYETGNKNLVPEISDKIEINHSLTRERLQLRSDAYYSITRNFITQISTLPSLENLVVTYVNGDKLYKAGFDMDLNFKIFKSININPGFSIFHISSGGIYDDIDLSTNNFAWTANIKGGMKIGLKTDLTLLLNYSSPVSLPQFDLNELYYADCGIKRYFFGNKLSGSITLTDIFNSRNWNIQSDNNIFRLHNDSKTDTRILWFGLTFNFNSFKPGKLQKQEEADERLIKLGQ